jgi:hypothetical protein
MLFFLLSADSDSLINALDRNIAGIISHHKSLRTSEIILWGSSFIYIIRITPVIVRKRSKREALPWDYPGSVFNREKPRLVTGAFPIA